MLIELGNTQILLGTVSMLIYLPSIETATSIEVHFIGGEVRTLDTPEQVKGFKEAISALKFGVGTQILKGSQVR